MKISYIRKVCLGLLILVGLVFSVTGVLAQTARIAGRVISKSGQNMLPGATVFVKELKVGTVTDFNGNYEIKGMNTGTYTLFFSSLGFMRKELKVNINTHESILLNVELEDDKALDEIVVTGTLREVSKDDSPVNIDVITPKLFQKTAAVNLFEATNLVNGVKPQINCNVCNTGDIHINGLEGPYTLILIDGMPIVSGLSSVYGLMGIPTSMIGKMEIAKGPASALYGTEAMGGIINVITKDINTLNRKLYLDYNATSYNEHNLDLSTKLHLGKKVSMLTGFNTFYYDTPVDKNHDNFTDVTLSKRLSIFNKINFNRKDFKVFSVGMRGVIEDRWGGEMNYEPKFRLTDSVYGESITTKRAELISKYEWPIQEKVVTQLSYNIHDQNSAYGTSSFIARQSTTFLQTFWDKPLGKKNDFLIGVTYKNIWFDDNTPTTTSSDLTENRPDITNLAGIFVQDEIKLDTLKKHRLLLGFRGDYHRIYKFIPSPRIAYKFAPDQFNIFRLNLGKGFRIVNVFTEDHMALTGAREVVFVEKIRPEESYNGSLSYLRKWFPNAGIFTLDASVFYYYFTNKIVANYDADPDMVIYKNLEGYGENKGASLALSWNGKNNLTLSAGVTFSDVFNYDMDANNVLQKSRQIHSPQWTSNYTISYVVAKTQTKLDLTGNITGPMRLPVLPNDYRPEYSPWFNIVNVQITQPFKKGFELYGGVKNLFNFIPENPIMRPFDPFDKTAGDVIANPNGYTFDPSYNYASMQGIRVYLGVRMPIN